MRDIIMIVLTPLALTIGAAAGTIRNRLDWRTEIGLQQPALRPALLYGAVFVLLMAVHEALSWWIGGDAAPSDWRARYDGAALALRVVFASSLYPIAEEFFFRGFLLALINRKAGAVIAVLATTTFFTALHSVSGPSLGALQIFADGVFFAIARLRTGSLYVPMACHVVGNTLAVAQRLL
jgi:membrane protease YdiL (CAAX protease family)